MGVYIKGMKMPKGCYECYLLDGEYGGCKAGATGEYDQYRKDCPLIEIPVPHGRLVDADVYKSQFQYWGKYDDECLDETPTVIEAEDE